MKKTSPLLIGIASVIPGLGLWILGKRKHAVITGLVVLGTFFLFLFAPWEIIYNLSCNAMVFLWGMQIFYAVYDARMRTKIETGEMDAAKEAEAVDYIPAHIPRKEKIVYKAKEVVRQQLNSGEHLEAAVWSQTMSVLRGMSSYKQFYVGLLTHHLIFIGLDFMGKPASVKRVSIEQLKEVRVKQGFVTDLLILSFGENKPMKLKVPRNFRTEMELFQKKLSS